jgi:biotin operon repressor
MFDGSTFDPELDGPRLSSQLQRVKRLMQDGRWHSLRYIADVIGGSEAGVSARIRDLRKLKFGGYTVDRQRVEGGLWVYRLKTDQPMQLELV